MLAKPTYEELEKRVQANEQRAKELESEYKQLWKTKDLLEKNQEELSQIFRLAVNMICIADIHTLTFRKVNPAFTSILGYSEKELLERSFLDFVHPEDIKATSDLVKKKLQPGETILNFENRYRCSDGNYRWLEWTSHPVPEQGVTYAIAHDITDSKISENALIENKRLLEETQAIAKLGGWEYIVASERVIWTEEVYRIYGIDPSGVPLDHSAGLDCYVPAHRTILEKASQTAIEQGVPYDLELQLSSKDGTSRWARIIGQPVIKEGEVLKVTGYLMDITDRKQAEETLRKYERIVSTSQDYLVMVNTEYLFEAVNDSFLKYIDKTREDVVGHPVGLVIGDKFYAKTFKPLFDKAFEGQMVYHHFDVVNKGTKILEATFFPMVDENGNVEGAVVNVRDITKTQRLEEQLIQSQRIESIGRLAGGVAHDLNNLLTPIIGFGEMLLEDFDPGDPRKSDLEEITCAGLKARDLVQQLLAFSRKQTLEYESVNMNEVVTGFEKLLRRTIRENVDINVMLNPDIQMVMADVGQIEQVIMNLAVNAADAMPLGGQLTIETSHAQLDEEYVEDHQEVEPGQYVMLSISDTGCGMDSRVRKHLFEPFFSTKGAQGTGLGLATVYGIIKQHRGHIWVYSEPGQGTIFKIYLPFAESETVSVKVEQQRLAALQGPETILLVEDNEHVRNLGHAMLMRQGYLVLVAGNGEEALACMASYDGLVHLLLTDIIMPGMNGKELYERAAEKQPGLKVLYMSGYTDNVIAHQGILDAGGQLIQKPFTLHGLAAKVREVLG